MFRSVDPRLSAIAVWAQPQAWLTCAGMSPNPSIVSDERLARDGFVHITDLFETPDDAWITAHACVSEAAGDGPLEVIGDFVLPPPDGPPSRDFQTLHIDFGLPLVPAGPVDVARFTALHVPRGVGSSPAITRLVPLRSLLGGGEWPDRDELLRRFAAYGHSHGAWNDSGYLEGSLARILEAALGETPVLPSVRSDAGFLCGTEFSTLADELDFFDARGLPLDRAELGVRLRPGELLVFDNLNLAHGRRGARQPGELRQRVFGHPALHVDRQAQLRDRVLALFRP